MNTQLLQQARVLDIDEQIELVEFNRGPTYDFARPDPDLHTN